MRIFLMFFIVVTAVCRADYFVEYVWYRVEPEQSRIVITWEHLRGHKAVDGFVAKKKKYEAEGKFLAHDYGFQKKEFVREEQLDGHTIKTVITIWPPRDLGMGGAVPDAHVTVYFDGRKRIDCPIGFNFDHSVTIPKIVIYTEEEAACAFLMSSGDYCQEEWNFFDLGDNIIVFEDGKLLEKPNLEPVHMLFSDNGNPRWIPCEEGVPRIVEETENITIGGKLIRETFPGSPNYQSIEDGDQPETYWLMSLAVPIQAEGKSMETGASYLSKSTFRIQLVVTKEQYASFNNMLDRQVEVSGEVFIAHTSHHKTPVLLDLTRGGTMEFLGNVK